MSRLRAIKQLAATVDFEVVVLGGGPAGCATALALAQLGIKRILIVEAGEYQTSRVGESIPPDTRCLLEELGIWQEFMQEAHDPCLGSCSSWGDDALGYNDFLFNPLGHGWHLDRKRFDRFLARMAAKYDVDIRMKTSFLDCEQRGNDGFRLRLKENKDGTVKAINTQFVVDAMGMHSGFARRMGAKKLFLDRLICVYGFFELPASHDIPKLTLLEAAEYGWWYAARLPNGQMAVAVASDPETVKKGALHSNPDWMARLKETSHLARHIAGCRFIEDSMLACPAVSFLLDKTGGKRWLAVGDAASAYDPISSQGIYKALSDGLLAAKNIAAQFEGRADGFSDYQSSVTVRFDDYVENRNYFYGMEQRWPASTFWSRRQERTTLYEDA